MEANTYSLVASRIIKQQEEVIGPVALEQAKKVGGLSVDNSGNVSISGDGKDVLEKLVRQYEKLFGRASIEVCKDAVRETKPAIPPKELPEILK